MPKIPLKINTSQKPNQRDIKNALNLNLPQTPAKIKRGKFWPILAFCLLAVSLALGGLLFLEKNRPQWQYAGLIPQEYRAAAHIKLSQLADLSAPLVPGFEANSPLFSWLKERVVKFAADSGLAADQVLSLFENEAIVAVLPQIGTEENSWVFLAKLKPGDLSARQSALGKIELGLKNDFFLNETSYRQLKIRSVHSLTNPESQYFYCQANDYIAISNGQAALVSILDRIIGR